MRVGPFLSIVLMLASPLTLAGDLNSANPWHAANKENAAGHLGTSENFSGGRSVAPGASTPTRCIGSTIEGKVVTAEGTNPHDAYENLLQTLNRFKTLVCEEISLPEVGEPLAVNETRGYRRGEVVIEVGKTLDPDRVLAGLDGVGAIRIAGKIGDRILLLTGIRNVGKLCDNLLAKYKVGEIRTCTGNYAPK